jgi:hypothetical protein
MSCMIAGSFGRFAEIQKVDKLTNPAYTNIL